MASPSGSPRRGRTLVLDGIPYDTQPCKVLERLQALAGRLQRACTTRRRSRPSSPSMSMVHSLAARQQQRQRQQPANPNESASIPGCPCLSLSHSHSHSHSQSQSQSYSQPQLVYSLKAEFSTREAANKARDLLIAQPRPDSHDSHRKFFGFNDVGILPNFVVEEEDLLLDIPAIISTGGGCSCCGVCGVSGGFAPSPRSEDIHGHGHGRRTSAEGIDPTHLCVPTQHNGFSNNGNIPYNNAQSQTQTQTENIIGFSTSTTLSSGSSHSPSPSLASPHPPPSRLPHSRQGSYSTFSSVSARSSPSAPPQHLAGLAPPPPTIVGASPQMEPVGFGFTLPPFDSRDPFHPHHSHSGLQDGLLFDGPSATRPKIPALGGYATPAYLSHSRSSSYGQTPTATTYQAPFPFHPQNLDQRERGVPQRFHASAASSPSKIDANKVIPVAPAVHEPTREHHQQQIQQSQVHRLGHAPLGEGDKQYSQYFTPPVQVATHALGPALASDNIKKLDFRAALNINSVTSARPHLAAHNRSQSMGVNSRVNGPSVSPPTTHGHMRSSSAIVVGNNSTGANNRPNANTNTSGSSKCNGGHKRSKSSVSSTHSHTPSHKSAENQKTYAFDPHRGPRSTDWMLSSDTLAARPAKDAKFAQMVALGLARGRTKAGWAQARRPGKRDRDAAKKKLMEGMSSRMTEVELQAEGGDTNASVDEVVEDMKNMTITGACACVGTTTGAA